MDNQRLFLFIALCFVGLLLFQAWQEDYGARTPAAPQTEAQPPRTVDNGADEPAASAPADVPAVPEPADAPAQAQADAPAPSATPSLSSAERIHVRTDVLDVTIDTVGGDVRRLALPTYPVSLDNRDPYPLMDDRGSRLYVAQSGFAMAQGEGPNHRSVFSAEETDYRLPAGRDTLEVPLHWRGENGVEVTKVFVFRRGQFDVQVRHEVHNASDQAWRASYYRQLQRQQPQSSGQAFIYTYTGAAIYTPENHYEKIDFSDMEDEDLNRSAIENGWVAMLEHYFLSAWVPGSETTNTLYSQHRSGRYYIGMKAPVKTVEPGARAEFTSTLYAGPKIQDDLEVLAKGLELTVDYGILTFLSKPLFWLLKTLHNFTGNWGWAIILLTLLIKIVFYKLSETSYRSMAKMRKVQPRMQALKERYGDDKQKMNQALMDLYKTEKINPLGGCLPILVQIPVFIALYWVLLESVELRQAPFVLWIHDLSTKDPYFVLPVLMGITMFIQQRLNPAPMDPLQQKIMMALPLVFTVFFAFFPAGLVLYWLVNNALSIAQQWVITKRIADQPPNKA